MQNQTTVISTQEIRQLMGNASHHYSDEEIADIIARLETLATIYINKVKETSVQTEMVPKSTKGSCADVSSSHNRG